MTGASSSRLAAACLLLSLAFAATAAAQPASGSDELRQAGEATTAMTPPELEHFVQAEYPAEARARELEADVVLAIDIDEAGRVTRVEVVEPKGHGFDEAAREAALKFVFRPARRGDRPVRSRILYRYSFHFESPPLAPAPPETAALDGRVVVADGQAPIAGARVRLQDADGEVQEVAAGPEGSFRFGEMKPGRYEVEVSADGYDTYTVAESLKAGEHIRVKYNLVPALDNPLVITVRGQRPHREVTKRTVTRRELNRVPGTSGDALRALENMPGVARPPSLSGTLVVRGNANQTTPVFIDGMFNPNIYHFGGLSSVVPTEMLDEVNFYPGNFSVRFGRALAGIVDVHLRQTRDDGRYHGLLQLDLIDVRAMAEGPVPFAGDWNFIGGIRRSHVDAWLIPLIESEDLNIEAAPVYYDYQFLVDRRLSPDSYLRVGVLGFDDRFRLVTEASSTGGELDSSTSSWGIGSLYEQKLSQRLRLDLTLTMARVHQGFSLSTISADTIAYGVLSRADFEYRLRNDVTFRFGHDVLVAPYTLSGRLPEDPGQNAPDTGAFVTSPPQRFERDGTYTQPALYGEMEMRPSSRWQVVSGVRVDYDYDSRALDVSPRMTGRYDLAPGYPRTTLKAGSGLFFQPVGLAEIALKDPDTELRSRRAFQNSVGLEQELTEQVDASVEGFLNLLDNLVSRQLNSEGVLEYNNFGTGKIFGAELMLRYKPDARFFGWLSYTLSRSERTWVPGESSQLFAGDQTHILAVLGSYDFGRGWEVGARFRFVSGNLYTPCEQGLFSTTSTTYLCQNGPINSERLSPFHQLDIRVDKRWVFSSFTLSAYLDLINAYNRQNPDFVQYNYDYSQSRQQTGSLPIVPSLGMRGEF